MRLLPKCPRCGKRWHDDPLACARAITLEAYEARVARIYAQTQWYLDACRQIRKKYPDRPDLWKQLMPRRVPGTDHYR
jgi:hypothetical protein